MCISIISSRQNYYSILHLLIYIFFTSNGFIPSTNVRRSMPGPMHVGTFKIHNYNLLKIK